MVVDKNNSKRTDRQQLRNPDVRQRLKRLTDMKGLERQASLQPSDYERLEGIGGKKRGGKTYHSPKYEMVSSVYSGGRKHKIMKGGMDRPPRRDTPPPQRPNTPEEEEPQQPRRGRPKKSVVKEEKPPRGKGKMKGGMDREPPRTTARRPRQPEPELRTPPRARQAPHLPLQFLQPLPSPTSVIQESELARVQGAIRERNRQLRARRERRQEAKEDTDTEGEEKDSDGDVRGEEQEFEPRRRTGRGRLEITHYEGGAKLLGKSLMEEIMKDPKFKLMGKGFFDKLLEGAKEFTRGVALPVKVAGKLIGNVVPPLKMAGQVVEGIDDPKWLKELKGKGKKLRKYTQTEIKSVKGGKLGSPLQVENPNVKGSGFLDNLGYKKDLQKLGRTGIKKVEVLKKTGGKRKLSKGASDWIQFVKKVAQEKNITYPEALKVASKMRR